MTRSLIRTTRRVITATDGSDRLLLSVSTGNLLLLVRSACRGSGTGSSNGIAEAGHAELRDCVPAGHLAHALKFLLGGLEGGLQSGDLAEPAFAASETRAWRLSRISSSRGCWAGSGRSCGHLTQLCS